MAGQVAADPEGNLVKGSVTEQAHQICKNISEILKEANSSLEKVVKVTVSSECVSGIPSPDPSPRVPLHHERMARATHVFTQYPCTDLYHEYAQVYVSDFSILPEFNSVYNDYFPQKPPRTSMEVSRLPLDVQIEVDVNAVI